MNIETHQAGDIKIAEVISEEILVSNPEEGLQLMADLYYQEFDKIILYERNISADFFDLKTGLAGEILQKFSNYRVQLVIVGNFSKYGGKSIKDFILESNNGRQVNFLPDLNTAIEKLSK
ncbi:MAG TPA: DUF4180 domain-containing protein [Pedobacter sp.]|uniref:DUF4180 domain-containing protein n=1 Tax=Pedobacter sp. TaxID=1411316 RepID=UPI002C6C9120|nr:DUF4180 domain-containing protein [Pedobacter sp.]HMI04527.1 DUF4180 domain-containing protein [Pedobacter sp.]